MNDQNALELERKRLQERLDDQPDSRVFAPLADCLRKLGRLPEALGVCHTGLSNHPRYSSAYVILGKIHLERGDDAAAREAFGRVLEFDPQNLLALRQLAELDEARDDYASAVERWELVATLEIDPVKAEERLEAARAHLADPVPDDEAPAEVRDDAEADDEPADDPVTDESADAEDEADQTVSEVDDAAEAGIDHAMVGAVEDRSHEVLEVPPHDDEDQEREEEATVPTRSALAPYHATHLSRTPDGLEDTDLEDDVDEEPVAPAPSKAAAVAADDAIPTTEIATMTLAEIYAEQGFEQKAIGILRQVLERNPGADKVAHRIEELETALAAPPEPAPEVEVAAERVQDPEVARALDPEPLTLEAAETSVDTDERDPEVEPAPPLTARTSPESEEEDERERYGHFRSWLDRIRVDD